MLTLARICESILPITYCTAVGLYGVLFTRRDHPMSRWARPVLILALLIHATSIYARTVYHGHCLVYTPFEMMTLISFTIALTYLIVELGSKSGSTGVFFIATALLFDTASVIFSPATSLQGLNPALLHYAVGLHISFALFGYTAFAISAVYACLYLMLYHQIRKNRFGTFYSRLPSLQLLGSMGERSGLVGVLFLVASIVIAVTSLPAILPDFTLADPKTISSAVICIIYITAFTLQRVAHVNQRIVVIVSLVGFIGAILSMTVLNMTFQSFHKFR